MPPTTAYDTAWVGSRVGAGKTTKIAVNNLKGVVPTTSGVMVRLTTRGAASGGFFFSSSVIARVAARLAWMPAPMGT